MSIDQFFNYLGFYRGFFKSSMMLKKGFWVLELIVAMAVLAGFMLVLTKFACNMALTEADAIKRMEAMACVSSMLENPSFAKASEGAKRGGASGQFYEIRGKIVDDFMIDCTFEPMNEVENSFPNSVKDGFRKGLRGIKRAHFNVSFMSGLGGKRECKVLTGLIGDCS